jgi:peptidoglycan/xylan/chitin deacetylase (PgdA/CDA1 family)
VAVPGLVRRVAGSAAASAVVDVLERLLPSRTGTLAALTFHRVAPDAPDVTPGILSATPETFGPLLDAVARRHAVIPIEDVVARADRGRPLPRRALVLTFDDAYDDFAEHAWPALRARALPATLFVPTAYPDAPGPGFWWDRLFAALASTRQASVGSSGAGPLPLRTRAERVAAYRELRSELKAMRHEELVATVERLVTELDGSAGASVPRVLGWEALRRLAGAGVTLAPHTRTHPLLPRLAPALVAAELSGSREDLARQTGADTPVFAYPSGAASPSVVDAVAAAGFRVAFTTARGTNDLRRLAPGDRGWFLLRRVNVSVRTPAPAVRAQLLRS